MASAQRVRRNVVVIATAALLLGPLGGCGAWLTRDTPELNPGALQVVSATGKSDTEPSGHEPFVAAGDVSALTPGSLRTLQVTVTNPDQVAYRILELTATPHDANAACIGATNLLVGHYDSTRPGARRYVVPRRSSITIPLTVMMLDTPRSQDACNNVTFPIVYSGLATQGSGGA